MPSVKTAISIDEALFDRADSLAKEMGVSRSQVFALALQEYLRRRENALLLKQINAAFEGDSQDEERELAQRMRRHLKKLDSEW